MEVRKEEKDGEKFTSRLISKHCLQVLDSKIPSSLGEKIRKA